MSQDKRHSRNEPVRLAKAKPGPITPEKARRVPLAFKVVLAIGVLYLAAHLLVLATYTLIFVVLAAFACYALYWFARIMLFAFFRSGGEW